MKQKELFFQYYRFSACVDANYDIKESIKDIQQRDKLIVAGRGFFSRVAGFVAGRGFLTKIAGFFAGIFFAGFFPRVLISCYAVLARGGEMYINIGSQTDVFFSKYKVYFLVFC